MLGCDLCNSLMEDDVGLIINAHQLAFKRSVVLCGHAYSLAYVGLL